MIYLVGTPIGNLADISLRALEILKGVERILAEDTRQTAKLLSHYSIETPLESYHEHNKRMKTPRLVSEMLEGKNFALVSDAGMPGISDPGQELVAAALEAGVKVEAIPGPSAFLVALVISGLPSDRFLFEGFLPREGKARRRRIRQLAAVEQTLVLYEAPHRVLEAMRDLREGLGDRRVAVARELTKRYEEVIRESLSGAILHFEKNQPRGEFTLVIEGKKLSDEEEGVPEAEIKRLLKEHLPLGAAAASRKIAEILGVSRKIVYQIAIEGIEDGKEDAGSD